MVLQPVIEKVVEKKEPIVAENKAPKLEKPVLKSVERRSSSLSLKSIHLKKEEKKETVEENFDDYPKDAFTEKKLLLFWKDYIKLLQKKGESSMASIISSDNPKLNDAFLINFTVPNKLMQDQFLKGRPKLVKFLREKLNNYGIDIEVILNETKEKKFAYTPQEKFNKLREKNPLLDKLRQTFDLDL